MNPVLRNSLIFLLALPLWACDQSPAPGSEAELTSQPETEPEAIVVEAVADPHSHANPGQVRVNHLELDLDVDFGQRRLVGNARLELDRRDPQAETLVLDTRRLEIRAVRDGQGQPLEHELGEPEPSLGRPLRIRLGEDTTAVTVAYRTSPEASGLQWLTPEQTAGGEHPFLFTQSQAIHARSWIPLQDTPQVRFTYEATIRTPDDLRAVMSANNDPRAEVDGSYRFTMPQPIPSYLMALAVGRLEFQSMSERTGVYAEPPVVQAAAAEFEDTEAMMRVSEELFGPYRWGRYDLLILPPSFPFGGMENPRLSFITPTVIAGDKSLVALIAHELAHSWSGNLVTNATWNDLWLNEGFTVYLEARIMEEVYGAERRAMEDVLGYQSLQDDLADLPDRDESLSVDLEARDPDAAFSNVPYEKGRLMLVWLEHAFGRERFDRFLRGYFDDFAFRSLDTATFLDVLERRLLSAEDAPVTRAQVEQWLHEPGLPEFAVLPESDAFAEVDAQRSAFLAGALDAGELETDGWTVHEWLYFLNNLPQDAGRKRLEELDRAFDLTDSRNAEIAHSWLRLAIRHRYEPAFPRLRDYLTSIGRRKLIDPLYRDLVATDWGTELAREIYREARPGYHPQAAAGLDPLVLPGS